MSLVWISNMVVSRHEEKAMSLLEFNPSLCHSMSSFHLSYIAFFKAISLVGNFTLKGHHCSIVNFLEILETVGSYLLRQITSL